MTRKELTKWFLEIENKYQVEKWTMYGVHCWPILKVRLLFWYFKKSENNQFQSKTLIKDRITILVKLIMLPHTYLKLKRVDCIFVGQRAHREKLNSKLVNKFFYPLILKDKEKKFLYFEYGKKDNCKYSYSNNILFVEDILAPILFIRNKLSFLIPKRKLGDQKNFNEFCQIELYGHPHLSQFSSEIDNLKKQCLGISNNAILFERLLRKCNPKKVLFLCYYGNVQRSILYASKRLNIYTADFQHGSTGDSHPAYGSYNRIPNSGYNCMPDEFLTWDEHSYRVIQKWAQNTKVHTAKIFGNTWVDYWKDKEVDKVISTQKKIILFSLQPLGIELLTTDEIELIKSTHDKFAWLLRLHPRQLNRQNELLKIIKQNNLDVECNLSTSLPLPVVLSQVNIHCTRSSGVTIEALSFGVPTLILHEVGKDYYYDLIRDGKVFIPDYFTAELMKLKLYAINDNTIAK